MVLLFVLATFPRDGLMLCVSLWDLSELGLIVFRSRLTIILTVESGSAGFALWVRWRQRHTSFFVAPFIMRSEVDFSACFGIASLFMIFSATMISIVSHFIFERPLCSVIARSSHCFRISTRLLSSLLPFSHHYLLCVGWKGLLALLDLPGIPNASGPGLAICISDTPLLVATYRAGPLLIDIHFIQWLTSFRLAKTPKLFLGLIFGSLMLYIVIVVFFLGHFCVLLLLSASVL